MKHVTPQLQIF